MRQQTEEANASFLRNFIRVTDILEYYGSDVHYDKSTIEYQKIKDPTLTNDEYKEIVSNNMKAIAFLLRSELRDYFHTDNIYTPKTLQTRKIC